MGQENHQELSKEDAELLIKSINDMEREEAAEADESPQASEEEPQR